MRLPLHVFSIVLFFTASFASGEPSDTQTFRLSNGLTVMLKNVAGSDIVHLQVGFRSGSSELAPGKRSLPMLTMSAMPLGAKGYPKDKIFDLMQKNSIHIQCRGAVENSSCEMTALEENLPAAMKVFGAILKEPTFAERDVNVVKERSLAGARAKIQDPDDYVNEVVNKSFYPPEHPYRLLKEDIIKELPLWKTQDLKNYHQSILNPAVMQMVIVSAKKKDFWQPILQTHFGKLTSKPVPSPVNVTPPSFQEKNRFSFEDRDVPTAYLAFKFPVPGARDPDSVAFKLFFEILSDQLFEEVRTKRSLSYGAFASALMYQLGIGIIEATTSKPKEAIAAIAEVLHNIKDKPLPEETFAEYKNVFVSHYYLTLETHDALAGSLSDSLFYFGNSSYLDEFPARLKKVTAADIQRLAKTHLKQLRAGVIFSRKDFQDDWLKPVFAL